MEIVEAKRGHIPVTRIEAGDYLEFIYNGKRRSVVVIAADYKGNMDAYEVTDSDREELLKEVISWEVDMEDGLLWNTYGSGTWPFKSFKREKIHAPLRVEFKYKEDKSANTNRTNSKRNLHNAVPRTSRVENPPSIR